MATNIIIDEFGNPIPPTDYKAKRERIEAELKERVFDHIKPEDVYDVKFDQMGNEIKKKRKVAKGEIKPVVTTSRVQAELESILILEEMKRESEIREIAPTEYFTAYSEYCKLVAYINEFVPFRANKQSYCAFVGILNDDFEDLLSDQTYGRVFKRIRDSFTGGSFIDASSGLYDSKAIINESQTRGDGLNMIKNPEIVNYTNNNTLNYNKYDALIERINSVLPAPTTKKIGRKEKK